MRLIDASFVVYAAESEFSEEEAAKMRWLISHIPTVDAVPVVRCANCGISEDAGMGEEYVYCNRIGMVTHASNYCGCGEPKLG